MYHEIFVGSLGCDGCCWGEYINYILAGERVGGGRRGARTFISEVKAERFYFLVAM